MTKEEYRKKWTDRLLFGPAGSAAEYDADLNALLAAARDRCAKECDDVKHIALTRDRAITATVCGNRIRSLK